MRKTLAAAAGSTLLVLGGLTAAPATANSDENTEALITCAAGDTCFWVNSNYGGARGRVSGDNPNFRSFSQSQCHGGTWNDCISSIANRGRECTVYYWTDASYNGRYHSLGRNDQVPDFGAAPPVGYNDPAFNDTISSNHWCTPR
ncbi:peptidase inhibitor family I36 protein [Streptomyces sp. NPDC004732]|uniref:peptidase inhibitor family I36 protein n=1 Tax=Streptomyces sp. NPDC004732 TaxID=3154290 RepID=UPI0033B4C6DE